eukprot:TRINITY_DN61579_c0_g1_i1.p1 TRINITY_DN61579_c0_g1~~TRINITY_DN61579_c0_g1_i1.p1  ORF type:complete len:402 (+),score=85.02 TRINITY_DN61579_c0_g1_i1:127-1332(+)
MSGSSGHLKRRSLAGLCCEVIEESKAKQAKHTLKPEFDDRAGFSANLAEAAASLPPDVKLIAADGSKHFAHRLILGAWSPFFKHMFSCGMREQMSGEVNLPDVEHSRLTFILSWMHGKEMCIDSEDPSCLLDLLELAKRWEIAALCKQICECDAFILDESNLVTVWIMAERLSLDSLEKRCLDFAMAEVLEKRDFSEVLKALSPGKFCALLASDDLPVSTEEETFELAKTYIGKSHVERSSREQDEILLAVRWRLVPGPVIAKAMLEPVLQEDGNIRSKLLPVLADAMQFQLIGGALRKQMKPSVAGTVRLNHKIPVWDFSLLEAGMRVRVVDEAKVLRSLCQRKAPGAAASVKWASDMKAILGTIQVVKSLEADLRAATISDPTDPGSEWYIPFDALMLA